MPDPILYYRPIHLKPNRRYDDAEWRRLSAPLQTPPHNVTPLPAPHTKRPTEVRSDEAPPLPSATTPLLKDGGNPLESGTLPAQRGQAQDDPPSPATPSPSLPAPTTSSFISRSEVAGAQRHRAVVRLAKKGAETTPGNDRAKINHSIRVIRDKPYIPDTSTKNYVDVDGNPIGIVQVAESGQVPSGCIPIAATRTVSSVGFDFVEMREQPLSSHQIRLDIIDETHLALRFTAVISKEGHDALDRLAKQIVKSSPHRFGVRFQRDRPGSVPNQEIKRILRERRTFDTTIEDVPTHISTIGKVEIHSLIQPPRLVTADELHFPLSKNRHQIFTKFSAPPKRWVLRTTEEFNQSVSNGFHNLAKVLRRIFD